MNPPPLTTTPPTRPWTRSVRYLGVVERGLNAGSMALAMLALIVGFFLFPVTIILLIYAAMVIPAGLIGAAISAPRTDPAYRWIVLSAAAALLLPVAGVWVAWTVDTVLFHTKQHDGLMATAVFVALLLPLPICLYRLSRITCAPHMWPDPTATPRAAIATTAATVLAICMMWAVQMRADLVEAGCMLGALCAASFAAQAFASCVSRTAMALTHRQGAFASPRMAEPDAAPLVKPPESRASVGE